MAALTIRNIDEDVKARLRVRAATNGRSMEGEVRAILAEAVSADAVNEGHSIVNGFRSIFEPLGGVELELPPRRSRWKPPILEP